jgi:glycosyltransferase involved in cell wall biosynthesis
VRLLFVTGSLGHGGAERQTITLINRLAQRGHECHAAYVQDNATQRERLESASSTECLHAQRYLDFKAIKRLGVLLSRIRPSAVVAANPYAMLYASLALRQARLRAPLLVTFHTTLLAGTKEWMQMLYYRPFFWSAECLVFVCEAQRRYWLRRLVSGRANRVIHNGVDPEHWRSPGAEARTRMRRVLGLADNDYAVGMCAVFRPEKNHLQLLEAIAQLRARGLPARALLIGDGPMRPVIEARARDLGIAADVLIAGFHQDVRPLLAASDAIALPSTSVETFSLAALEAMALGRPVVLSQIGGAAEMVRPDENGFLFPAHDTPALVASLAALAEPALRERMGAAARTTVEARFSERAMVDRYEGLLQQLVLTRSQRDNLRRSAAAHQG